MAKKKCFVIMGYGLKTDYEQGRTLDLDKTYFNVIKPAVKSCGLECVRADEIIHSGIIDMPMFENILKADIVIADLSTSNPNALYELGVRHALKPFTTIVMAEKGFKYPFDLNHTVIMPYEHLEKDIGVSEAKRFKKELKKKIQVILSKPKKDSPVYTYLHDLQPPCMAPKSKKKIGKKAGKKGGPIGSTSTKISPKLSELINKGVTALDNSKFPNAIKYFQEALKIDNNPFIVQKIVLATYKNGKPSIKASLENALKILNKLSPNTSHDPETLGLAGAINKRLWEKTNRKEYLNKAISFYEKGFYFKNDYYNGINYAYLLNVRSANSKKNDAIADYVLANRIREEVVKICNKLLKKNFDQRGDQYWVLATLEEAYYALGRDAEYKAVAKKAKRKAKVKWERESTEEQIDKLNKLISTFTK